MALLLLEGHAQRTRPAQLVSPEQEKLIYTGAVFKVAGWGAHSESGESADVLTEVELPIVSNSKCGNRDHYGLIHKIYPTQFCAGYDAGAKDACLGDSGSPMFRIIEGEAVIVGFVSWGAGCGRAQKPGVYTRVSAYRRWIMDTMREHGFELGSTTCAGWCGQETNGWVGWQGQHRDQSDQCGCDSSCTSRNDCCPDFPLACPGFAIPLIDEPPARYLSSNAGDYGMSALPAWEMYEAREPPPTARPSAMPTLSPTSQPTSLPTEAPATTAPPSHPFSGPSCKGRCGDNRYPLYLDQDQLCWCDSECYVNHDCCPRQPPFPHPFPFIIPLAQHLLTERCAVILERIQSLVEPSFLVLSFH